jgi:pimeloyl-ACP methyl ester carboxylesterase
MDTRVLKTGCKSTKKSDPQVFQFQQEMGCLPRAGGRALHLSTHLSMKTYILLHGSWHGAWNWHRVAPLLRQAGHKALTPDLPAHGRDQTPPSEATLAHCVDFLCKLIDAQEEKVILLGHSKNGIMISQVAEYRPECIEKLVYLAAYLIPNGAFQRQYSLQDTEGVLKPYVVYDEARHATTLLPEIYQEGLYADCGPEIEELARVLLRPEPMESALTPLQLTEAGFGSVPRVYIECLEDKAVGPLIQKKMYTEMPCEKVYTLHASHSPFFSQPSALADILLEIGKA